MVMSAPKIYVELGEINKSGNCNHNAIMVSADYKKREGGIVLSFRVVDVSNQNGFEFIRLAPFSSPATFILLEGGWKRDNKKKVAAEWARIKTEVETRAGRTWDDLVKFAKIHDMTIKSITA
jgi:hypothetical protein